MGVCIAKANRRNTSAGPPASTFDQPESYVMILV